MKLLVIWPGFSRTLIFANTEFATNERLKAEFVERNL